MKLLVFSPYYPPHIGGLETHADEFNKHLSREGARITVFTPQLPHDAPSHETRHNNVTVIRFPAFEVIHNYPVPKFWSMTFWQLFGEAVANCPDIVVSRTRFFSTSLIALAYAKIKRIPWVHIEHGSDFAQFNGSVKTSIGKFYDYTLGKLVLMFSDTNVANSLASAKFVTKLSGRNDCRVIYRGIETEAIAQVKTNSKLREQHTGKIIVGYIGRLIDGKGLKDLLEALMPLHDRNFVCFIVGEGPEQTSLEQFVKKHSLEEKVLLFGNKPFSEAIEILKACDIFVNPSYTEGIPTAVIEAALCKKAIIATNVGGTSEIVADPEGIILIPPKNHRELSEKLDILMADPTLRQTMGNKAFAEVEQKFSWSRAAKQYLKLFKKILKKSEKRPLNCH